MCGAVAFFLPNAISNVCGFFFISCLFAAFSRARTSYQVLPPKRSAASHERQAEVHGLYHFVWCKQGKAVDPD